MKYLHNFNTKLIILLSVACIWISSVNASYEGHLQVGVDGTDTLVAVWHTVDIVTGHYKVQGTSGNTGPWTVIDITSPLLVNAFDDNVLGVSNTPAATTLAAVAWRAFDLITGNKIIQATTLTTLGWRTPTTLSINDGTETPLPDYQVDISDDGTVIAVTWTGHLLLTGRDQIRISISIDGGATWSIPQNLSNF